jgi:hypothetical protein
MTIPTANRLRGLHAVAAAAQAYFGITGKPSFISNSAAFAVFLAALLFSNFASTSAIFTNAIASSFPEVQLNLLS